MGWSRRGSSDSAVRFFPPLFLSFFDLDNLSRLSFLEDISRLEDRPRLLLLLELRDELEWRPEDSDLWCLSFFLLLLAGHLS